MSFRDEKKSGRQHAGLRRSIVVTFALDIAFVLLNEIVVEPFLIGRKGQRWSLLFTPWGVDVELNRPQTNRNQRDEKVFWKEKWHWLSLWLPGLKKWTD